MSEALDKAMSDAWREFQLATHWRMDITFEQFSVIFMKGWNYGVERAIDKFRGEK